MNESILDRGADGGAAKDATEEFITAAADALAAVAVDDMNDPKLATEAANPPPELNEAKLRGGKAAVILERRWTCRNRKMETSSLTKPRRMIIRRSAVCLY